MSVTLLLVLMQNSLGGPDRKNHLRYYMGFIIMGQGESRGVNQLNMNFSWSLCFAEKLHKLCSKSYIILLFYVQSFNLFIFIFIQLPSTDEENDMEVDDLGEFQTLPYQQYSFLSPFFREQTLSI